MKRFALFLILLLVPVLQADWLGTFDIDEWLGLAVTTHRFSSGAAYTSADVQFRIYEETNGTWSTTEEEGANDMSEDFDGVTGLHTDTIQLTAAEGFEVSKSYLVVYTATVDSVAAIATDRFRIRATPLATASALATVDTNVDDIEDDTGTTLDTLIKDIPTVTEFEARTQANSGEAMVNWLVFWDDDEYDNWYDTTDHEILTDMQEVEDSDATTYIDGRTLAAANYFLFGSDDVAKVTLVVTTTTNSDMVGEPSTALSDINLDHWLKSAVDTNLQTTVHDNSVAGYMLASTNVSAYVRTEDSLEDLRDRGDDAWDTATGFAEASDVTTAHSTTDALVNGIDDNAWDDGTRTLTALDEDSTTIDLDGSAVGSVTAAVTTDAASRTASKADVSALATSAALTTHDGKLDTVDNYVDSEIADIIDKLSAIMSKAYSIVTAVGTFDPAEDSLEAQQENPQGPPIID